MKKNVIIKFVFLLLLNINESFCPVLDGPLIPRKNGFGKQSSNNKGFNLKKIALPAAKVALWTLGTLAVLKIISSSQQQSNINSNLKTIRTYCKNISTNQKEKKYEDSIKEKINDSEKKVEFVTSLLNDLLQKLKTSNISQESIKTKDAVKNYFNLLGLEKINSFNTIITDLDLEFNKKFDGQYTKEIQELEINKFISKFIDELKKIKFFKISKDKKNIEICINEKNENINFKLSFDELPSQIREKLYLSCINNNNEPNLCLKNLQFTLKNNPLKLDNKFFEADYSQSKIYQKDIAKKLQKSLYFYIEQQDDKENDETLKNIATALIPFYNKRKIKDIINLLNNNESEKEQEELGSYVYLLLKEKYPNLKIKTNENADNIEVLKSIEDLLIKSNKDLNLKTSYTKTSAKCAFALLATLGTHYIVNKIPKTYNWFKNLIS